MKSDYRRDRIREEIREGQEAMSQPVFAPLLITVPMVALNALWAGPIVGFFVTLIGWGLMWVTEKAGKPEWLVWMTLKTLALRSAMDGYWQSVWIGAIILVVLELLRNAWLAVKIKLFIRWQLKKLHAELAATGPAAWE